MRSPTIVCAHCGEIIQRSATCLECGCRFGLVAQWDKSLGDGLYEGSIIGPSNEMKEVPR
jgi:ribosomal protein L32